MLPSYVAAGAAVVAVVLGIWNRSHLSKQDQHIREIKVNVDGRLERVTDALEAMTSARDEMKGQRDEARVDPDRWPTDEPTTPEGKTP